jgi:hypothetical protein
MRVNVGRNIGIAYTVTKTHHASRLSSECVFRTPHSPSSVNGAFHVEIPDEAFFASGTTERRSAPRVDRLHFTHRALSLGEPWKRQRPDAKIKANTRMFEYQEANARRITNVLFH